MTDAAAARSSPAPSVLAIDAGQTGMKVRVRRGAARDDIVFDGIRTHEPLLPQLAHVVRAAMARTGLDPGRHHRRGSPDSPTAMPTPPRCSRCSSDTGIRDAVLAHDSTTSFLGALGDARGAVVASGTGVVTLAVGRDAIARVDGWGYIMGDAGSGYWIGREALDAVMRAFDGRGPADRPHRRRPRALARSDAGLHRAAGFGRPRERRRVVRRARRPARRRRRRCRARDHRRRPRASSPSA